MERVSERREKREERREESKRREREQRSTNRLSGTVADAETIKTKMSLFVLV